MRGKKVGLQVFHLEDFSLVLYESKIELLLFAQGSERTSMIFNLLMKIRNFKEHVGNFDIVYFIPDRECFKWGITLAKGRKFHSINLNWQIKT